MKYIDIHAHLNFKDFDIDRAEIIAKNQEAGLAVINIGTDLETSEQVYNLAAENNLNFCSVGFHPTIVNRAGFDFELTKQEIAGKIQMMIDLDKKGGSEGSELNLGRKIVSIGECGLDYYHFDPSLDQSEIEKLKEQQKIIFEMQIELAMKNNLPVMIHCRDAYSDTLEILERYQQKSADKNDELYQTTLKGNFHFFAGDLDVLEKVLKLGFTVSYTGVITFASQFEKLIKATPIDRIHAETDSPFVAPTKYRGQRNEPVYVLEVIQKIAKIKKIDQQELEEQLLKNAKELFNI